MSVMKTMHCRSALLTLALAAAAAAQGAPATHLPIREVTAFKDGHAFVLRQGDVALGADGRIVLDELPQPILGTFWPAVHGDGCTLRSVTAGQHRVEVERTATELRQMLAANVGREVVVREFDGVRYRATIVELPQRPGDEVGAEPGTVGPALPVAGDCVLLRTTETRADTSAARIADAGLRLVRLDRIIDVTFLDDCKRTFADAQLKPQLVLDIACKGERPATVPVELGWVEHGFRWAPSYRVELDGDGGAMLRLEATLVDDLGDLADATVHLVVGVPNFVGKDQLDPMALQDGIAQAVSRMPAGLTQHAFSNAMRSQVAFNGNLAAYSPETSGGDAAAGDEVPGHKDQDLYVFTVTGISLKKGERMVLPIFAAKLEYADVYTLDLPVMPPTEAWNQQQQNGDRDLARLMAAPKVQHVIRLKNTTATPFTTAPALITRGPQVLAQGTLTYTAPKRSCDVRLTTAIDLTVDKRDEETGRKQRDTLWNNGYYTRIDLTGRVRIANNGSKAVRVEVKRHLFGRGDEAQDGGALRQLDPEDCNQAFADAGNGWRSYGWYWGYWGYWSVALNGIAEATWSVPIEPGKEAEVHCTWHYYWH